MDHSIISKVLFLLVILHVGLIASYLEVTLTDVNPIVHNDTKFINFDNIKIHRMNKTEHVISGYFEAFVELSNDYEVNMNLKIVAVLKITFLKGHASVL